MDEDRPLNRIAIANKTGDNVRDSYQIRSVTNALRCVSISQRYFYREFARIGLA